MSAKIKTKAAKDAEEIGSSKELYNFLYEACNILRGPVSQDAFKEYITPLHKKIERSDLSEIVQRLRDFNRERDWEQFHDAKNLALSISIEASELNECFLWKNADEADRTKIEEELADVFLCAIMLADKYDINIKDICLKKIERNAQKYPVEKAKGKSIKYDEL